MAGNNTQNVSVGKPMAAGGAFTGPIGTAVPEDATTALAEALENLGFVSDEGLTNAIEMDTEEIKDWEGNTVLVVRTSRNETFVLTFIETNEGVMKVAYGPDNVTVAGAAMTVIHNGKDFPAQLWVFEIAMTGNRVKRIVVPQATVTEVSEVTYVAGEPIGYGVTLTCTPDSNGATVYEYIATVVPAGE